MKTELANVVDPQVRRAEGIAEKVALNYMGQEITDKIVEAMQLEYKLALDKAEVPEGLITLHLDQQNGSIFIYQPAPKHDHMLSKEMN